MDKTIAVILAGGRGERLGILAHERTKPAIPFAGKYRIIDFTLSNCVNSGISRVALLTQYQPLSLIDHIGIGSAWGLATIEGSGLKILQPYLARDEGRDWYKGTADAVYQNLKFLESEGFKRVLILSGDHIYRMDYSKMAEFHDANKASVTVATTPMPYEELVRFGTVSVTDEGKITAFQEKVKRPDSNLVSMGIYLFDRDVLIQALEDDSRRRSSRHDFGRNIFPKIVTDKRYQAFAYNYHGYWRDVGTIATYWEANMDLLEMNSSLLFYDDWPMRTKEEIGPPAIISQKGEIVNSMISNGCIIEGRVEHSVLSPGVKVAEGALVKDSIILNDTVIGPHSTIDYSILDKEVNVEAGCYIGSGDNFQINKKAPKVANTGITIVGKWAKIPQGTRIGRNCIIYSNITHDDFPSNDIQSGETVSPKPANNDHPA